MAAYMKEHPWGEHTGGASVRGRVLWSDGGPLEPVTRLGIQLKGEVGSPLQGVYYNGRTDARGEFAFDRILAGDYQLTDYESRWDLQVSVRDGEPVTLELSPENATKNGRNIPDDGNKVSKNGSSMDVRSDAESPNN
jgi:hypothetical protein